MSSSTESQDWLYRWATLADLGHVQHYIHTHWLPDHLLSRDLEFLKWQYGFNATSDSSEGKSGILLATRGETIGGMLGIIANECVDHGRSLTVGWYAIWSVAEPFRQFGLGLKLLEHAKLRGYDVVGTLGANILALSMYRLLKYQIVPAMLRSTRLFSWPMLDKILATANLPDPAAIAQYWKGREAPPLPGTSAKELQDAPPAAEDWHDWDKVWRSVLAPQLFSVARTAAYFQQRYVMHPYFQYHIRFVRDGAGLMRGCCVYRIAKLQPSQINMLRIVEFLAVDSAAYALLGEHLEVVAAHEACAYADFSGTLRASHAGLPRFEYDSVGTPALPKRLSPVEFSKTTTSVCWSFVKLPQHQLETESEVYLTSGDGDQDRPN